MQVCKFCCYKVDSSFTGDCPRCSCSFHVAPEHLPRALRKKKSYFPYTIKSTTGSHCDLSQSEVETEEHRGLEQGDDDADKEDAGEEEFPELSDEVFELLERGF